MNRKLWDAYEAGDPAAEAEVDHRIDLAVEEDQISRAERRALEDRICKQPTLEGELTAIRTNCVSEEETDVRQTWRVRGSASERVFEIAPGVTGYESFYIRGSHLSPDAWIHGWTACAGTTGSWDKLHISRDEMVRVMSEVREWILRGATT